MVVLKILTFSTLKNYFIYCWYSFSQHILYKPDLIEPNLIMGQIHVLYFVLFF